MTTPVVRAGIARGRALFNRADFWGSHEALETAWHAAAHGEREVVQGLIQAAAAFHKIVVQDNPAGAARLLDWALQRLDPAPDGQFGLALDAFRAELRNWVTRLSSSLETSDTILGLPQLAWSATGAGERMDVDAVTLYRIERPTVRAILVAVQADDLFGWGECRQNWEAHGAWPALGDALVPALLAEPVAVPSEVGVRLADVAAQPCAVAGLEAALWDLWARRAGLPLVEALGMVRRPVPLAGRVYATDSTSIAVELEHLTAAGYRQLLLPARPNADRRVLPPLVAHCQRPVALDLGGAYRMADLAVLRVLDGLGVVLLHQPFPDWARGEMVRLRRYLDTRLSQGGWTREEQVRDALAQGALDVINVDPGVCGLSEAIRIADLADGRRVPLWVSSSAATAVGAVADLALAAHRGVTLPSDLAGARGADGEPVIRPGQTGAAELSCACGLGIVPDPDWLAAVTAEQRTLRA